jgi:hypothetical protein
MKVTLRNAGVLALAGCLGGCAALGLGSKAAPGEPEIVDIEVRDTRLGVSPLNVGAGPAGKIGLEIVNNGQLEHNLRVEGPGLDEPSDTSIAPGQHRRTYVRVRAGTYRIYCPDADHAEKGVDGKLIVHEESSQFNR